MQRTARWIRRCALRKYVVIESRCREKQLERYCESRKSSDGLCGCKQVRNLLAACLGACAPLVANNDYARNVVSKCGK